jgi:hypothetical protein
MAFRTETKAGACIILWLTLLLAMLMSPAFAETRTYEVRHVHFHHGGQGVLRIDENSISFEERGKQAKHSRQWKYDDIQQLVLGPEAMRIVTYEDSRWELGRDRVWLFDQLPTDLAEEWYPILSRRLDRRFVAALADEQAKPKWQIPVKLAHGRGGSQGVLLAAIGQVVYKSVQPGESRTWRMGDIENVSSSGPFDLTITTQEREFRFQLKQALSPARFDEMWRRVNQANGLLILSSDNRGQWQ